MASPAPGYMAILPQSSPLLSQGAEEEEDDTRRRLFFDDGLEEAELAGEAALRGEARERRSRSWRVSPRAAAACTGLALVCVLAATAPLLAGYGPSARHSEHLSGSTGLAEEPSQPWASRVVVTPKEAAAPPALQFPQTPSPAPLPTLLTLAPLPPLPPVTLPTMPPLPTLPPLATLAPLLPITASTTAATEATSQSTTESTTTSTAKPTTEATTAATTKATTKPTTESTTAARTSTPTTEATTKATTESTTESTTTESTQKQTTEAATTSATESTATASTAKPTTEATTAATTRATTKSTTESTTAESTTTASTAKPTTKAPAAAARLATPAPPLLATLAPLVIQTPAPLPWSIATVPATTLTTTTVTTTTLVPPDICSREAPIPQMQSPLRSWELPDITKDVCFRMFSDQVKMTDHGKHTFDRNFCWVMMKRYGCLNHLGDKYTWARAQETVSSLGGVPPASTSAFEPLENPELCDRRQSPSAHNWTRAQLENASRWFQENVAVYVLNLNSEQDRWRNVTKRLDELQILRDRVPGFNMSIHQDLADAIHEGAIPEDFNMTKAQEEAKLPHNGMGGITGTVGCAAGHFRALHRASKARARRPITLILEDDARPDDDFVPQVWSLVRKELPCGWDAVSLGSRCPFGKCISERLSRVQPDGNEPEWRCRHGVNYGFQGVLYRTDGMEDLVKKWMPVVFNESRPHCLDVDVALAAISDQVAFYAVPSLQALLTEQQEQGGSVRVKINGGSV